MKISVAMCTYFGEEFVKEQLDSILNQSHKVDEIIICDDSSKDNTLTICEEVLKKNDVSYIIKKNKNNLGFIKNFYQCLDLCTGDIIFFSDQDDVWKPNKVEKIVQVFNDNADALLVFTDADVVNQNLEGNDSLLNGVSFDRHFLDNTEAEINSLLNDNFVTGATMAIRKELKDIVISNAPCKECPHDYWLAFMAALNNGLYCCEEPLIYYRQHDSNTIGINKKYTFNRLKKLFSSDSQKYLENQYSELRLPVLYGFRRELEKVNNVQYLSIVDQKIKFWKDRENFFGGSLIKNLLVVLRSLMKGEQRKNRNARNAVLMDFVKALALAKKI